jgi:NAD(P)-dependent dehydrogenase (short-subunit alcohol dehydrogenase family)
MLGRSMARLVEPPPQESFREKCRFIVADLTNNDDIGRVNAEISLKSRLDVLVLSSGTYERSREPEVFARQIAANLVGPYALIQQLLPLLIEAKGQVVFINSSQALRAAAGVGQYAATKHAMKAVADSLRQVNTDEARDVDFLGRTASGRQRAIFAAERHSTRRRS